MKIGVLALQGAFREHEDMIRLSGAECIEIRQLSDLTGNSLDGIVLPGGESTVQGKLLRELGMLEPLRNMIKAGTPVLATCAGLILLAEKIEGDPVSHLHGDRSSFQSFTFNAISLKFSPASRRMASASLLISDRSCSSVS